MDTVIHDGDGGGGGRGEKEGFGLEASDVRESADGGAETDRKRHRTISTKSSDIHV